MVPSCLMFLSLWNSEVSTILTISGCSIIGPWMGSLQICNQENKMVVMHDQQEFTSTILTISGCSIIGPWMGSLQICNQENKMVVTHDQQEFTL